jgi:uncharacterized protein YutE (UPF0331/DUF86 family)
MRPGTDASDVVILHLWQAVQLTLDLAISLCFHRSLETPKGYRGAFERLAAAGLLPTDLATRLGQAAGLRNRIVHGYEELDLARVYQAAAEGPRDLRRFFALARVLISERPDPTAVQ